MTRQAVTKHLAILEAANLVVSQKRGREKLHFINPVPINEIAERWIGKFERPRLAALAELKRKLEGDNAMTDGDQPLRLRHLHPHHAGEIMGGADDPEFMKQYWFGMRLETDWKAGAPWKLVFPDGRLADAGEIAEFEPPRRLASDGGINAGRS